ncbi:MAG: ComEA family DNA-binding protein [Myxococcota bacterium]
MTGASGAAWLLAAGLCLAPLLPAPAPELGCARPGALDRDELHSRRVSCAGGAPLRGPARLLFGLRLDPNLADAKSLESLPGIGPARAAAIVAERDRRRFESLEALTRVSGIGPRTLERLRPWLEVAPERTAPGSRSG